MPASRRLGIRRFPRPDGACWHGAPSPVGVRCCSLRGTGTRVHAKRFSSSSQRTPSSRRRHDRHGASSTEARVRVRTTFHVTRATANPSCRCSSDPKTREPRPKAVPKGSWSPWRTARLRGARAQSHGERGPPAAWGPDRAACLHSRHCRGPRPPSPWLLSAAPTASVSFLPPQTLCFVKRDPIVWEPLVPLNRMTVTLFIGRPL